MRHLQAALSASDLYLVQYGKRIWVSFDPDTSLDLICLLMQMVYRRVLCRTLHQASIATASLAMLLSMKSKISSELRGTQ